MDIFELRHGQNERRREPTGQWMASMGEASLTDLQLPCASPSRGVRPMTVNERRGHPDPRGSQAGGGQPDDPWSFCGPMFGP